MTTSSISTRGEAETVLKSGCEELIGLLRELQGIHLKIDGSEQAPCEPQGAEILRLRKIYLHVQAIAAWKVTEHVLHVMAPDIRAALEQLDPLTLESFSNGDKQKASKDQRQRERVLGPLSHPTPITLIHPPHLGGLGKNDLQEFLELLLLLGLLANSYGLALGVTADSLGYTVSSKISDVCGRNAACINSVPLESIRQFIQGDHISERIE